MLKSHPHSSIARNSTEQNAVLVLADINEGGDEEESDSLATHCSRKLLKQS
jgi:hypothetical protein